jgi:hypothetical protein
MTAPPRELGLKVGHRRICRLMGKNDIKIIRAQKYKTMTNSNHTFKIAPNLLDQHFYADGPNQKCAGDISYIWVILPFLTGGDRRTYAAIFSFIAGVMPPMPIFGRSLLYVHNHCVAKCWASSLLLMMYWSSHSCLTVRL